MLLDLLLVCSCFVKGIIGKIKRRLFLQMHILTMKEQNELELEELSHPDNPDYDKTNAFIVFQSKTKKTDTTLLCLSLE